MTVIVYQSLNSNSSSTHGIKASNSQNFTALTHDHYSGQNLSAFSLIQPTLPTGSPYTPVYGPPSKLELAPQGYMAKGSHTDQQFLSMVEGKARQMHQTLIRFSEKCDLMVFGELDNTHSDWSSLQFHAGPFLSSTFGQAKRACQCFSLHSENSNVSIIASDTSWVAVKCIDIIVLFVHVPNSIAGSPDALLIYYNDIKNEVTNAKGGGTIDLVMGDTNQKSAGVTPAALTKATGSTFIDAHAEKKINPFDTYNQSFFGTNSKGTEKYDVAVYNSQRMKAPEVVYLSQFSPNDEGSVNAITDHMGVAVKI
ncbi:hypothetical protein [Janthinobacterium aquaticum]|uniref:hypothetical protein n=1 Tax=Janthinobacterium sp. FT58W TaxID=2654254 RepID=UPI0012647577|nr:hypothetical protein [Janthinobacterium sp. FT58W]KAB8044228.1 hypothetical protein GCM43_03160 [Janthinobacterium sp. FT58W]